MAIHDIPPQERPDVLQRWHLLQRRAPAGRVGTSGPRGAAGGLRLRERTRPGCWGGKSGEMVGKSWKTMENDGNNGWKMVGTWLVNEGTWFEGKNLQNWTETGGRIFPELVSVEGSWLLVASSFNSATLKISLKWMRWG